MNTSLSIRNISELLLNSNSFDTMKIQCRAFNSKEAKDLLTSELYLNSNATLMVLAGSAQLIANYQSFTFDKNKVAVLSSHLFKLQNVSDDFCCIALFVTKYYMDQFDTTEMIPIRTKYEVKMYKSPVVLLSDEELERVKLRWTNLAESLFEKNHYYYKLMVQNMLKTFFLDLSHFFELHGTGQEKQSNLSRHELITKSFVELLINHFREEHTVDYYAEKLNLSNHYLNLIVKKTTGRTPSDFIYEMLYSEAKALLLEHETVQRVALQLHFSDQSSFGKFFKRRSGESPFVYRSKL